MYWEEDAATAAAFCTSSWASSMLCWALLPGTAVPLPPTPHGTAGRALHNCSGPACCKTPLCPICVRCTRN